VISQNFLIDADGSPGPRRSRDVHPDPMIAAAEARRRPSASNLSRHRSPSRLMSGSNPSLESQLAHDFQRHASFAASSSATSLGRHGASHLSLHDSMPPVPPVPSMHQHGQGSAPPSPYGHPKAAAVANGAGLGRQVLPSISQWDDDVNPMFRVVSPLIGFDMVADT
jgi:meiosis induction protein kinase IME2/SME1